MATATRWATRFVACCLVDAGYAPTEVSITGVVHEYSTLEGVQEDVVDLLLNLKGVVISCTTATTPLLTLKKEGAGPVTAGDKSSHEVGSTSSPTSRRAANSSSRSRLNVAVVCRHGAHRRPVRRATAGSARSCSTHRSARSSVSATSSNRPALNSAPTSTSWCSTSRPMVRSSRKAPSATQRASSWTSSRRSPTSRVPTCRPSNAPRRR